MFLRLDAFQGEEGGLNGKDRQPYLRCTLWVVSILGTLVGTKARTMGSGICCM